MTKKETTQLWDKNRGVYHTKKGGWVVGEAVYNHGYSMLDELVGKYTFFQVLVLNVTGALPEKRLADWMEASFICLSWPDPRIWCNKMGSFAGSSRCSPATAVSMGILAADSRMYAAGAITKGAEFITMALEKKKRGIDAHQIIDEELSKLRHPGNPTPVIMGYARPIATGDERIPAMERTSKQLKFEIGPHLELAYEIDNIHREKFNETINMLGYTVAFMCDQGFKANEISTLYCTWVNSGVHACYDEALSRPAESFLPMHCEDINYIGHPERTLPKN